MRNLTEVTTALEAAREILSAAKAANQQANVDYAVALAGPNECDEWAKCVRTSKAADQAESIVMDLEDEERDLISRANEAYAEMMARPAKVACANLSEAMETRVRILEAAE